MELDQAISNLLRIMREARQTENEQELEIAQLEQELIQEQTKDMLGEEHRELVEKYAAKIQCVRDAHTMFVADWKVSMISVVRGVRVKTWRKFSW